VSSAATTAAAPPACSAGAYRHAAPGFCVALPADVTKKDPLAIKDGLSFMGDHGAVVVEWVPRSDAARIAAWKTPGPRPDHVGTYEVLKSEAIPGGVYYLEHDATQSRMLDIYKVPSLAGVAVLEGPTHAFRCTARLSLDRNGDPRAAARANAAFLETCKSLRPL
jgi:hypothetical protein